MNRPRRLATLCAHAGASPGAPPPASKVSPLYQQSVFEFDSIEASVGPLGGDGYAYRRNGAPNADELAAAVAALEGAERGVAAGSGMAAISAALFSLLERGDAAVVQSDVYGGSLAMMRDLERFGVELRRVDPADLEALDAALAGARVALFETLSNPLLRPLDAAAVLGRCRARGVVSLIDNTFATPLRDRPLELGADLVVHSATKFLAGHHDASAGVLAGSAALIEGAAAAVGRLGLQAAPLDCWLAVRGLRTLEVRMQRAWQSAARVAELLAAHPTIETVHAADRCALVSFDAGSRERAEEVVRRLELIALSPSLGGVTTTASHSASSSHRSLDPARREAMGITEGLLRLSIGLEDSDDLVEDLERALG